MKSVIALLLIGAVIFIYSCKKEDTPEPSSGSTTNTTTSQPPPTPPVVDYWGCWREATGKTGVYDIVLTEDTAGPHIIELATSCAPVVPSQDIGIFRNDTLILDNGTIEYWCFIVGDTMLYSAYFPNVEIEKFTKI